MQPQAEPWLLQRGEDEMDEGETAALQSMPLKLQQKKKKSLTLIHFPSGVCNKKRWCASANLGEEWVSTCSDAPMKIFNDHADFFCPALNGRLNCSVACTVAPELTQAKCHDSSETAETFKKGLFFSRTKVVSLWVCVDSLWPLFKSSTSSFSP